MEKSIQKNKMQNKMDAAAAAALLEGLWPLENEGLETAVVEEHERERLEWHGEPLLLLCDVVVCCFCCCYCCC